MPATRARAGRGPSANRKAPKRRGRSLDSTGIAGAYKRSRRYRPTGRQTGVETFSILWFLMHLLFVPLAFAAYGMEMIATAAIIRLR